MPSLDYALKWAAPQAEQQTQAKEPEKSKWSLDSLKRVLDSQGQMQIDLAKEQRRMAPKHLRNIATAPAVALELPLLAYNIPAWIYGNDGYSPSGRSARAIDKFAEEIIKRKHLKPNSGVQIQPSTSVVVFHGRPKPHESTDPVIQQLWQ